tara:strand:+ start:35370 stop:35786 length:417 start_codon:yes stop_codon:yes gene_type:complete
LSINKRHLAKTISWRFVGTLDTLVLSWIIAGSLTLGLKIGFFELITKMLLYYFHEKLWFNSKVKESNRRHLLKTFSWRFIATVDTIILAAIISGNPFTGLKIGIAEVLTKMILYFFHEKLWYRINYGLISRNNLKNFK